MLKVLVYIGIGIMGLFLVYVSFMAISTAGPDEQMEKYYECTETHMQYTETYADTLAACEVHRY